MAEDMNEKVNMSARAHKVPKRGCLMISSWFHGAFNHQYMEIFMDMIYKYDKMMVAWWFVWGFGPNQY